MNTTDLTQTGITIPMSEETELLFVLDENTSYKITAGQVAAMFSPKGIPKMSIELSNLRRENQALKEHLERQDSDFFSKVFPQGDDIIQDDPVNKPSNMSKEEHDALKGNS
jgi:hypothetical protein